MLYIGQLCVLELIASVQKIPFKELSLNGHREILEHHVKDQNESCSLLLMDSIIGIFRYHSGPMKFWAYLTM